MTKDEGRQIASEYGWMVYEDVEDLVMAVAMAEREACAKEAERMVMYPGGRCEAPAHSNVWDAAKAIRARGK
jgi:hypothetical protein